MVFVLWQQYESMKILTEHLSSNMTIAVVIQQSVSRLILVSLLTYALVISVRNFSAAKHNALVNRHRINALSTFETFALAASDNETKAAVLLEATKAVFSPQVTGLLKNEPEPAHGAQIIEIIKSVASTTK